MSGKERAFWYVIVCVAFTVCFYLGRAYGSEAPVIDASNPACVTVTIPVGSAASVAAQVAAQSGKHDDAQVQAECLRRAKLALNPAPVAVAAPPAPKTVVSGDVTKITAAVQAADKAKADDLAAKLKAAQDTQVKKVP